MATREIIDCDRCTIKNMTNALQAILTVGKDVDGRPIQITVDLCRGCAAELLLPAVRNLPMEQAREWAVLAKTPPQRKKKEKV